MCGIVGFCGFNDPLLLDKMNNSLIHRGPDDRGIFIDEHNKVSLAMRRLSIIDIESGQQPMANENAKLQVICNGEIYNFISLRKGLLDRGHRFRSHHSDTEVLVHLYEEKSFDMLYELNGMFSFVIYDLKKNILFGARDRMGIKPLYYICHNGKFIFASEIKALLAAPEASREIDSQSLYDYLSFQFIPAPATIFCDIRKLPAAHYFIFDCKRKELKIRRYWHFSRNETRVKSVEEAVELVKQEAKRAVREWSVSDVPIACSLSGGIDSSSIVGLLCSNGISGLKTFCLGFKHKQEANFDERTLARNTAGKWGTEHYEIVLEPDDLLRDLDEMVWYLDEPYGGGLPSWYVFKAMKGKVKVALTGTGGDELFGNYGKWKVYESFFSRLRETAKICLLDRACLQTAIMFIKYPQGYFYHRYFTDIMKRRYLFNSDLASQLKPSESFIQDLWKETTTREPRDVVPYIDFRMQLPEEFLHMTDRFSMAHSIEARTPLLDHQLVETVMNISARIRTKPDDMKYLFTKAMNNVLDEEVLKAPKKGFILPIDRWLRGPLKDKVQYYLGESYLEKQNIFSKRLHSHIVRPYLRGKSYLKNCVWTVFMFQLWHKRFIYNGNN